MRLRTIFIFLLLVSITFFSGVFPNQFVDSSSVSLTYFPTDEWRTASPEDVGINPSKLDSMYQTIIDQNMGIDSIHIVRHGYLVYEQYFDYYNYTTLHQMWSTTKSIASIVVGIANASGFISNLDEPILDIFSERTFANVDAKKQAITIRHLLQMQSGLLWNEQDVPYLSGTVSKHDYELLSNLSEANWANWSFNPDSDTVQMVNSSDWIQFVLDKPMFTPPGTFFYYNSGVSHLLSAIIQKKTGMNTAHFANQFLFGPLGISDYLWVNDSLGISTGGFGLCLRPFDMVKIGYLFLNNGMWNGSQIVPPQWVQESTQDYDMGYGYQWWIHDAPYFYHSAGFGGQFIIIKSDDDLVVAITASEYHTGNPWSLIDNFIFASILSDPPPPQSINFASLMIFISVGTIVFFRKKSD